MLITIYVISGNSKIAALSCIIYFSHPYLNKEMIQIRAGLASAIILLSIMMRVNGKNYLSLVYVFIASLFHSSALVALIPYSLSLIVKPEKQVKLCLILVCLSILFYILGGFDITISILDSFGLVPYRVNNYLAWTEYNYDLGLLNPNTLKQLFLLFLLIYFFNGDKRQAIWICYFSVSVCWLISFSSMAIIAARVASIISVAEIIAIPMLAHSLTRGRKSMCLILLFLYASVFISNVTYKGIVKGLEYGIF